MSDDDSRQLAKAVKAQYDHNNRNDVTENVVDEIKSSIIFQYRWEDLLLSGPVALTCLGSCLIASASNTARALNLEPPKNGFQFLKQSSLDANLVDSINLGRTAFLTADGNMSLTAKRQLMPQLNAIKTAANDCYKKAREIDKDFESWLNHTMELYAACVHTESTADERIRTTQLNMAVPRNRFTAAEDAVKYARDTVHKFGKQFLSSWDILGQQVVGALAETVTTALGQVVSNLASNLHPVARAESGANMFKALIYSGKSSGDGQDPPMPPAPPAPKSTTPKDSLSPAYAEIKTGILYLGLINAVLTKDKNDAQRRFQQLANSDNPSQTLKTVLETAILVANALQEEVDKAKDMRHKFPVADSDVVKGWQRSFADVYTKANTLAAVARSLPGTCPWRSKTLEH
ncbi:hypothetical protein MFIFM68171_03032 [Madurella fahalii]|uniref:Uncharacterized protein n=1 Tax=Madurella fahalii TaxID=1157608 RepID=A0ABQ0G4Z6_9PEZI